MRHFLVLFDTLPIDKTSVKAGKNSPEVVSACRCVNVGLFLSGDLRRDVTVSIATGVPNDLEIITFPGETLRRVSPDERSISFFILKALSISTSLHNNTSKTMDNGVVVQRVGLKDFLKSISTEVIIADSDEHTMYQLSSKKTDLLLLYDNREERIPVESLGLSKYEISYRPSHPERFILDVNLESDNA